ncbi:MAG: hypothetical protein R2854_19325 [Caldilineaceae bacterium]
MDSVLVLGVGSWALSLLCVLFSFFFSATALRKAVEQVDRRQIFSDEPGGASKRRATHILNTDGGVFFLAGVLLMITCAMNMGA